jgi:cell wall-associated NlpC family hydrolase
MPRYGYARPYRRPRRYRSRYGRGNNGGAFPAVAITIAVLAAGAGVAKGATAVHAAPRHAAPSRPATGPTGAQFAAIAATHVGAPYIFGAKGPDAFDCSGLVWWSLHQLGVNSAAESSEEQWAWVTRIPLSRLQPGDLIFEQWPGDDQAPPGHVVIYAGHGMVVEAPQPGESVHVRAWSPSETWIVGYGQVPGLRYS